MSHQAQPSPWRSAFSGACAVSLSLVLAAPAFAGVTDPAYRFERIGGSLTNIAAIVQVPGVMRATVLLKNGEIHRVVGDGLVDEMVGQIPNVSQMAGCTNDGVLDAAIDWVGGSQDLLVTYMKGSGATRKFTAARLPWTGAAYGAPVVLNELASTSCQNMGGGITQAADGNIFVGIGDMGNGPGAGQDSVGTGKLWRLAPTGGAAAGNPNIGSPIYGKGVCDPIRMDWDKTRNFPWFIDRSFSVGGGRVADELNFLNGASQNFAWPRIAGDYSTPPYVDPIYSWATPIGPTGLVALSSGGNFPNTLAGDLLISTATGSILRIHPTNLAPSATTGTSSFMYAAVPPDPNNFVDMWMPNDTYLHVATPGGEIFRMRNDTGALQEPSDAQSITPLLVSKIGSGANAGIRLTMEHETGFTKYDFYPGNIAGFPSYTHVPAVPLDPDTCTPPNGVNAGCMDVVSTPGSAWVTSDLSAAQLQGWPTLAYFFVSGMSTRNETVLGQDGDRINVPGGNQTFGCPCPVGVAEGFRVGDCETPFTLARGLEGAGNEINNVTVDTDFDCDVILLDLSEDWCYWCHQLAPDLEQLYQDHQAQGFMLITLISQDENGANNADWSNIQSWVSVHGSTNPVLLDENQRVLNQYFETATCGGFPETLLFNRDGEQVQMFCGADPGGIRAAVEALLQ
jgi:glucose/arabinose dehydrogenase